MSEGAAIRRLAPADAEAYREIRLEALRTAPEAFGSTFAGESGKPLSFFADRLAGAAVFAAERGGEIVGTAGLVVWDREKERHKGFLVGMYVRPASRGLGIGRLLGEAIIDHARSSLELIQLSVVSGNPAALRLYEGLGFTQYGLERHALKHEGRHYDSILMAKFLDRHQ